MEPEHISNEEKSKLGNIFHTQVAIQVLKIKDAIKSPVEALLRNGETLAVYRVVDGKAEQSTVNIFLHGNEEAVLSKGLREGDLIINLSR